MKRLAPARVRRAIATLNEWRQSAQPQKAMNLWGLLALVEMGVVKGTFKTFEEEDDFSFWDRYCRVPGTDPKHPYVDPFTRSRRVDSHPHSNVATARKQTVENSWGAVQSRMESGATQWKLQPNYAEIFQNEALIKARALFRVPVVDLAAWLFRGEEFADSADARNLEALFRKHFPQDPADYEAIFEFKDESAAQLFTDSKPPDSAYTTAIEEALLPEAPAPAVATAVKETAPGRGVDEDDPVLLQVVELLATGSSGVILRGAPGTGKTWYAHQIATKLVSDPTKHVFKAQFHPSYGYEDFVEGYRPSEKTKSGFELVDKVFLEACGVAKGTKGYVVLIIDEINRGDPARVLGELLTYIELDYRDESFRLPYSGKPTSIPRNLVVIGTMNPFDRSVTDLDMALVRRFDHIDLKPQSEWVARFLSAGGGFSEAQVGRVVRWFDDVQALLAPQGVGHTYFKDVERLEQLRVIWRYRILPYCGSALDIDEATIANLTRSFDAMYADVVGQQGVGAAG